MHWIQFRLSRFAVLGTLGAGLLFLFMEGTGTQAYAHEKSFPARQLNALTPAGTPLTYKEMAVRPDPTKLSEFEKKNTLTFSKGDLLGSVYMGSGEDKKVQVVAVFLDGKSTKGDTEFGASVNTQGRIAKVKAFSSPESSDATSSDFLASLEGKNADELVALRNSIPESQSSKRFIAELALKAIGRVEASFKKK